MRVLGVCENPEDKSENRTHFEAGIWVSSSKESNIYEAIRTIADELLPDCQSASTY